MKFGVMDHVDDSGLEPRAHFESRLRFTATLDQLGFYSYHVAEHHGTPLGFAPSPNVYLSAVAQRTRALRFGPMVYVAALYHPMRLAEEICMLDQLSGGRLQLGMGRGAVALEQELYGIDPATTNRRYEEARDIDAILSQGYHGSRYSSGYPACPRLEDQEPIFKLLDAGRIGVSLSDEFQIHPEQSTSALIVHHPKAKYFSV